MPENMKYADVYVGYPVEGSFTYAIPQDMKALPGMRVRVSFNKRIITAFIHRIHSEKPESFKLKEIIKKLDERPIFDSRLIELSRHAASKYICSTGEVLAMALPSGQSPSDRFRHPFKKQKTGDTELTNEQMDIYKDILSSYQDKKPFHLLYGITGSGKTEVYIELAKKIIHEGRSVIYLVPEITLSSQIFERLYNVFGNELIVYHSHLTANQRLYSWMRFYQGEAKIVVGTRSAVFLQCPDPGLIIIDEEHDGSYKEHSTPRYQARRIAYYRCKKENAILVMGSATPSIESLYAAEKGIFKLHKLKQRYGNAVLPEIDIQKINPKKGGNMISPRLMLYSKRAMDEKKQIIYLLNRRGFSPIVLCNDCGKVLECPFCNISLNFLLQRRYCRLMTFGFFFQKGFHPGLLKNIFNEDALICHIA